MQYFACFDSYQWEEKSLLFPKGSVLSLAVRLHFLMIFFLSVPHPCSVCQSVNSSEKIGNYFHPEWPSWCNLGWNLWPQNCKTSTLTTKFFQPFIRFYHIVVLKRIFRVNCGTTFGPKMEVILTFLCYPSTNNECTVIGVYVCTILLLNKVNQSINWNTGSIIWTRGEMNFLH